MDTSCWSRTCFALAGPGRLVVIPLRKGISMKDKRILQWMGGAALVFSPLGTTAQAQSAGSWLVRGGLTHRPPGDQR